MANQDKIIYRLAKLPEEEQKILELMNVCFGRDFQKDWFQWFNYQCPYGKNRVYVGVDAGKDVLVAAYGLLPYKLVINKKVMDGSLCTNAITHPEYQGKGIFTQIGRHALLQEPQYARYFSVGVPNKNALPGHLKAGWIVHSDLIFFKKLDNKKNDFEGGQIFVFTDEHGRLASNSLANMNLAVARDSAFLNWRYFKRLY
jgi:GNAT superfamily N-acetyltransferase